MPGHQANRQTTPHIQTQADGNLHCGERDADPDDPVIPIHGLGCDH